MLEGKKSTQSARTLRIFGANKAKYEQVQSEGTGHSGKVPQMGRENVPKVYRDFRSSGVNLGLKKIEVYCRLEKMKWHILKDLDSFLIAKLRIRNDNPRDS